MAQNQVLPIKYFKHLKLNNSQIIPSNIVIISYENFKSKSLGNITLKCHHKEKHSFIKFLIVDLDSEPLLGLNDCINFNDISCKLITI